jgi:beta-phosphoglucomutase
MITGAIFDLDGTLISTNTLHSKAWVDAFNLHGITLTDSEIREQAGMKCVAFAGIILKRRKISNINPQAIANQKDEFTIAGLKKSPAELFDGAEDFLKLLQTNDIKIAMATSASKKTALLLAQKIINYFDIKIFAEDVTKGKPDPEVFLMAAQRLGLQPSECIVFEDATNGIKAAKSGGFFCIANDNGLGQDLSAADLIIKDYNSEELIKLFKH